MGWVGWERGRGGRVSGRRECHGRENDTEGRGRELDPGEEGEG